jgi:hypothetical protein
MSMDLRPLAAKRCEGFQVDRFRRLMSAMARDGGAAGAVGLVEIMATAMSFDEASRLQNGL